MGPELGSLYHELEEEVDWLQQKWNEFRELFAKGAERIELLNTEFPYSRRSSQTAAPLFYLSTNSAQRVLPAQPRKAGKIPVRRVQHSSMLNRDRRDLRITHQRA